MDIASDSASVSIQQRAVRMLYAMDTVSDTGNQRLWWNFLRAAVGHVCVCVRVSASRIRVWSFGGEN